MRGPVSYLISFYIFQYHFYFPYNIHILFISFWRGPGSHFYALQRSPPPLQVVVGELVSRIPSSLPYNVHFPFPWPISRIHFKVNYDTNVICTVISLYFEAKDTVSKTLAGDSKNLPLSCFLHNFLHIMLLDYRLKEYCFLL